MMSKCWKSGDTEFDVIAELRLIIEGEDVNASDIVDLRSVIARLEEAILTLQLKRGHSGIRTNDGSKPIRGQRMPGAGLN
jgi:hypothetical protein